MRTQEQIRDRITKLEQTIEAAEAEIELKRGGKTYDIEEIRELERNINVSYQKVFLLEWVLGIRDDRTNLHPAEG